MKYIFCDESGFTGPDLLNADQPFFAYSSVCIEPQEAYDLLAHVRAKHPLQMPEWKGSKMIKTSRGREAVLAVFEKVQNRSITVVADKRFALAGKLLSTYSSPFYARSQNRSTSEASISS